MKIAIYSRKSVYTGKGESIENQIEMCRKHIFSQIDGGNGAEIVVYEDEGFSGKNLDRPQFKKMLVDTRKEHIDYIVCYRLDRISRSVGDFALLIEDLIARNISFVCIKEQFDTSTSMGRAMMYIASVFAQLERETIAERVRDNMMMLARTGRWLGGTCPTGFTSETVADVIIDGKSKTSCRLKFNHEEINIVKVIYEKFLELQAVSGVSKYLIANQIKSRTGKYFSLLGIKEILQNPVYCIADQDALRYFIAQNADVCFDEKDCSDKFGLLSYNKRDYKKKSAPRQSIEKWIIAVGKHRGIISGKEWSAVQTILEANKPSSHEVKMHNDYSLLSGVVYCSKCGEKMFSKSRSNNLILFDYMCSNKIRGGVKLCDCLNLNGKQADEMVCSYLLQFMEESIGIYPLLENLKKLLQKETLPDPGVTLEEQLAKCNLEMDRLIYALSQADCSQVFLKHIHKRMSELEQEELRLRTALQQLQNNQNSDKNKNTEMNLLETSLFSLKENFDKLTIHEKRKLIKLLIQKIEWNGKDLHVFLCEE